MVPDQQVKEAGAEDLAEVVALQKVLADIADVLIVVIPNRINLVHRVFIGNAQNVALLWPERK